MNPLSATNAISGTTTLGIAPTDLFWVNFWPALTAFLAGSLVVFLITQLVGHIRETRRTTRARRLYEQELSVLLLNIRTAIDRQQAFTVNLGSAIASIPPAATEIAELLKDSPLALWDPLLPDHKTTLALLRQFQVSQKAFLDVARDVDTDLARLVRRYNSSIDVLPYRDGADAVYILGKSFDASDKDMLPYVGWGQGVLPALQASYQAIKGDADLEKHLTIYHERRATLLNVLQELAQATGATLPQNPN